MIKVNLNNIQIAILCSLIASFSMAMVGFFSKAHLDILFLLIIRCFIPLIIISLLFVCFSKERVSFDNVKGHFFRSVFFIINQAAFFYTVKHGSLLVGVLLFNTAPLFIPLLCYFFFKEESNIKTILAIFIGVIGVAITIRPDTEQLFSSVSITGILSGFSLACSQLILQKNVRSESNQSCMFWFYVFSSLITLVVCFYEFIVNQYNVFDVNYELEKTWLIIIGISISSLFYQYFVGKSYQFWTLKDLAPITYTSIIFAGILDFIFWNRTPNLIDCIGMVIIISSCIFVIRNKDNKA